MRPREFTVQRIGDTYVTIPVDHYPGATRAACGLWGFILSALGLSRGGLGGTVLLGLGGLLAYRGVTGRSALPAAWTCCGPRREPRGQRPDQTPSYQNDSAHRAGQIPADVVDEASMESFPASDPPTRSRVART